MTGCVCVWVWEGWLLGGEFQLSQKVAEEFHMIIFAFKVYVFSAKDLFVFAVKEFHMINENDNFLKTLISFLDIMNLYREK